MRIVALAILVPGMLLVALPSWAQGRLGLLPAGEYNCALPGTAAGQAWINQPARDFAIIRASRYRTREGAGTYLLQGDRIVFTRGPLRGVQMMRVTSGMLQDLDEAGKLGRLRCHRTGPVRPD